jgi:competence protein ComEC
MRLKLFLFVLICLWLAWRVNNIYSHTLPKEIEGQTITLSGTIIGIPKKVESEHNKFCSWRFTFAPNPSEEWQNPGYISLSWSDEPSTALQPGQKWQFAVRLKRVHAMRNPGVSDYSMYLFQKRILTTGSIQDEAKLLSQPSLYNIDYWRYRIINAIRQAVGDQPSMGILIGLAVGERQWISQQQRQVLAKTGTAHLIAISGLHVGLIAALSFMLFWILRRVFRLYPNFLTRFIPAPLFALVFSLFAATCYALLAGFTLPTQRALIMLSVAASAILLARNIAISRILVLTLFAVLIWDPLSVLSAGFWLSFGAVAVILYALSNRNEPRLSALSRWGLGSWRTQWAVTLGLIPIVLAIFGYVSITSLVANTIAIPWVSFVIVPLTLLGTILILFAPTIGTWLLELAANTFDALWVSISWLANLPIWQQHTPPLWSVIVAMIGVAILLLPRGFPARWIGIFWLLPLFFIPPPKPKDGEVWLDLLDVGQGLAAVIRTKNSVLVYDTGAKYCSGFNTGEAVVVPFLRAKGIKKIDKLVISHGDNDHIGGTASVLENLTVTEILTSATDKLNGIKCQNGQNWQIDGVHFQILHPPANYAAKKTNDHSCVLKVSATGGTILLPGDIEKRSERYLVKHANKQLNSDILIVPHHGSSTSSTAAFIDAINPKIALFAVGYRNRFGHPKPKVLEAYHERNITTWQTVNKGAISIRVLNDGISEVSFAR